MKQLSSKTRSVRVALRVRRFATALWGLTPKALSRMLLKLFRNGESLLSFAIRYLCLWRLAKTCGSKVIVFPHVYFLEPSKLALGTNVSIHQFCYLDAHGGIDIGDDVAIAHGCSVLSSDHQIDDLEGCIKDAPSIPGKVSIGSGSWLGAGVRVLKGVTIGPGAVLAAGCVVTRDISENTVAGGVPAKPLRQRRMLTPEGEAR